MKPVDWIFNRFKRQVDAESSFTVVLSSVAFTWPLNVRVSFANVPRRRK